MALFTGRTEAQPAPRFRLTGAARRQVLRWSARLYDHFNAGTALVAGDGWTARLNTVPIVLALLILSVIALIIGLIVTWPEL